MPTISPLSTVSLPLGLRALQRWEFPRKLGLCERLYGDSLRRFGIRWVRTATGLIWKLDLANPTHRWMVYGSYEGPGFWRWLRTQPAPALIVDSGANIGQTIVHFAHSAPATPILAFEPGQAAREWLAECVAANALDRVRIFPTALGAGRGTAYLQDNLNPHHHGSWNHVHPTDGVPVVLTTLDDELAAHGHGEVSIWKLDLEGYELAALHGAAGAPAARRIRAIYMEVSPNPASAASRSFLRGYGYNPHRIADSGRLGRPVGGENYDNLLFLCPGHPARRP
ncbi:MAG: FkbM family methyltransferase [Undibacterium sp.]|nr:FkbM family methyltransferase [Opitutaceae bacterium]